MTESAREACLQGLATEWRTMTYTWRDCALYALAVGAGGAEPQYTYERDMQAIPTFGATPYWGTVNVTPKLPRPRSIPVLVEEILKPEQSYVNLAYEFLYHRPIPPVKGSFVYRDVLTDLFDRGDSPIPDRPADLVERDHIGAAQNLLYRLTGDTNLVHVDRAVAVSRGLDGPFVHDLCAYGYACRLAIAGLFPGQPERLRRMYAAMKTVLYPDTPVELHLWKLAPGRAAFRLCHGTTGKAILDRGELEWDEVV